MLGTSLLPHGERCMKTRLPFIALMFCVLIATCLACEKATPVQTALPPETAFPAASATPLPTVGQQTVFVASSTPPPPTATYVATREPSLPAATWTTLLERTPTRTREKLTETATCIPAATLGWSVSATPAMPMATESAFPAEPLDSDIPATGRLLRVRKEIDLGLAPGNAYRPMRGVLSSDGQALFFLATMHPDRWESALAAVSLENDRLYRVSRLPGYSDGPVVAGGSRVYLSYHGVGSDTRLLLLDAKSLTALADISLATQKTVQGLALDVSEGRLYVGFSDRLEVRRASDLTLSQTLPYEVEEPRAQLWLDGDAQRLYLGLGRTLRAYDASTLAPLWEVDVGSFIVDQIVDSTGRWLHLLTETWQESRLIKVWAMVDTASGMVRHPPQGEADPDWWRGLVGAESSLLYVMTSNDGETDLIAIKTDTDAVLARYEVAQSYERLAVYDANRKRIYVPIGPDHLLKVLGAPDLRPLGEIILGAEIRDIVVGMERLYVNDSAGRVHALDLADYRLVGQVWAGRGEPMVLDEASGRLYVPLENAVRGFAVLDTREMEVTAVITAGNRIAVDGEHGRLFIGNATRVYPASEGEVRVLDAETLDLLHTIPRPGSPAYNPRRDELYITDNSVYIYAGGTYEEIGELTPDIGALPFRGCNGCPTTRDVYIYADLDLLLADVTTISTGKGAGTYSPPRAFSLETLEPLTYPAATSFACGGKLWVAPPRDGVLYTTMTYSRYVFYRNLVARQAGTDKILRWRDGLNAHLVIPRTGVIYGEWDESLLVALDEQSWLPLGHVPSYCFHTLDLERGRLYATDGARLIVLQDSGGQPLAPPTPEAVKALSPVRAIYASPGFAEDRTIFLDTDDGLLRSLDGGRTWQSLGGEAAWLRGPSIQRSLAISPDYARDRTLFLAAYAGDSRGYGVLRSTDAGQTWQLLWNGLDHLRVHKIVLSPDYARDGTLLGYAWYQKLAPQMVGGESIFRSIDRGGHWELVASRSHADYGLSLPTVEELLGVAPPQVQVVMSAHGYGRRIERTNNGGLSWETVFLAPEGEYFVAAASAPRFPGDGTVYALSQSALYRSLDQGSTWAEARDLRISQNRADARSYRALALLPERDGACRLLLGDSGGNLEAYGPQDLAWEALAVPVPSPTAVPTLASSPIPTPCILSPAPAFRETAQALRAILGCPTASAETGRFATQPFQYGRMFWREETRHIYALLTAGFWVDVPDTWTEDQPPYDASLIPPEGLYQPVRGFGRVWREVLRGPNTAIGWATQPEIGYEALWQLFEGGILITDDGGTVHVLRYDMQAQP